MTSPDISLVHPSDPVPTDKVRVAGPWRLMWWKFRRHRLAVVGGIVTLLLYLTAAFAPFIAPFGGDDVSPRYTYAPPSP